MIICNTFSAFVILLTSDTITFAKKIGAVIIQIRIPKDVSFERYYKIMEMVENTENIKKYCILFQN